MRHPDTQHSEKSYYISIQSFMNYFSSIKPTKEMIQNLTGNRWLRSYSILARTKGCFTHYRHRREL